MAKDDLLSRLYDRDKDTGAYIISVSAQKYSDIFNDLDPSPLRRRDLDSDFVNYLEDCSNDIPFKYKIQLNIDVPAAIQDSDLEKRVRLGIEAYYGFIQLQLRKEQRGSWFKAMRYVVNAALLILLSYTLAGLISVSIWSSTLVEGLSIGGWVFLWEALDLVLFKNRGIRQRVRQVERIDRASVHFTYRGKGTVN